MSEIKHTLTSLKDEIENICVENNGWNLNHSYNTAQQRLTEVYCSNARYLEGEEVYFSLAPHLDDDCRNRIVFVLERQETSDSGHILSRLVREINRMFTATVRDDLEVTFCAAQRHLTDLYCVNVYRIEERTRNA